MMMMMTFFICPYPQMSYLSLNVRNENESVDVNELFK